MKAKVIGIAHTGNFTSLGAVEKIFNDTVSNLEKEGRELRYMNDNMAVFEDGSRVFKIESSLIGKRLTDLYIDESFFELENGNTIVREALLPSVLTQGEYNHVDASTDIRERVFLFNEKGDKKHFIN